MVEWQELIFHLFQREMKMKKTISMLIALLSLTLCHLLLFAYIVDENAIDGDGDDVVAIDWLIHHNHIQANHHLALVLSHRILHTHHPHSHHQIHLHRESVCVNDVVGENVSVMVDAFASVVVAAVVRALVLGTELFVHVCSAH
jgi:hypothetical protein